MALICLHTSLTMARRPKSAQALLALCLLVVVTLVTLHPSTKTTLFSLSSDAQIDIKRIFTYHSGIVTLRAGTMLRAHPLLALIEEGRRRAAAVQKVRDGVRILRHAAVDYRRAFGVDPPEGFDIWWAEVAARIADGRYDLAAQLNSTTAPSLIPLAHQTVLPFLALPPSVLRARAMAVLSRRAMCGARFAADAKDGVEMIEMDEISGRRITPSSVRDRCIRKSSLTTREWYEMFKQDARRLPPSQQSEHPMILPIWADDGAFGMVDGELLQESRRLVGRREGIVNSLTTTSFVT